MKEHHQAYCDLMKQEINFPAGLDTIDSEAFSGCALTEVTLPENVFCGMSVFKNCTSLRKVTLPEGMTKIPYEMFKGCVSLKHINIPASVREVISGAFTYCKSLTDIDVQSDIFTYTACAMYGNITGDWSSTAVITRLGYLEVKSLSNITSGIEVKWSRIAKINNASATGFTDTTAAKGVKYTYTIRSYSGSYLSYWNSVRSAVR